MDFQLDYVDRCEELGAAYGRPPFEVLAWPWVHVEEIWTSYMKRQRRKGKHEVALAQLSGAAAMTGGLIGGGAGSGPSLRPPTDADDYDVPESEVARLAMMGLPVKVVTVQ